MSKKVAQIIVETLQSVGVKRCYGIVGDTLNAIAKCIEDSDIEWVHVRHEEAGGFAAAAEASLTGNLTACAGSCGPGGLHFINGIFEANRNRAPVLLIATQILRGDLGFDSIQEVNFKEIYQSCSVFCDMIYTPEQARRKTVIACQTALAKRGAAVLIVPVDVAHAAVDDDVLYSVHVSKPVIRPNDAELDQMAAILNSAKNVTIYGGSGCQGAHDEVVAVAKKIKAPIAHTSRGKDFLEYDNPHNIGMTGILGTEAGYKAVLNCDALLLLGADFAWGQFYPDNGKIVQVDIEPSHLGRRHPVAMGVIGSVKPTLEALLPRLKVRDDASFHDEFVSRHRDAMVSMRAKAAPGHGGGISGPYLTEVINKYAAENALFAADDGTPTAWMVRHIDTNGKRRTFASLLHGSMAGAMPSALGLQKCQPGRQVISLSGDGGLAMLLGDVMTTIQEDLPIKIVVYDNGKLGFVDIEQKAEGMLPLYTDLKNPNFAVLAQAFGLWGRSVTKAPELDEAVQAWLAQPGPALLHVKVNPMQLVVPPFIEAKAVASMALYTSRAILHGRGGDVWEMVKENFL
jgi:pyruvate dehydrogenase (quinone)